MALPLAVHRAGIVASSFKPDSSLVSPVDLFTGATGYYHDPRVLSSMWQDAARTIPVTADGDPVGAMNDLSGNGHHVIQATAANRPIYRVSANGKPYLELNGSTQSLYAENATNTVQAWSGSSQFDALELVSQITPSAPKYWRTHRPWTAGGNNSALISFPGTGIGTAWANVFVNSLGNGVNRYMGTYAGSRAYTLYEMILGISSGTPTTGALSGTTTSVTANGASTTGASSTGRLVYGSYANSAGGPLANQGASVKWYGTLHIGRVIDATEIQFLRDWWVFVP